MDIKDIIIDKIEKNNRDNIVYCHPVIPDEEIAEYISAFSNGDGGIILFGVLDDGNKLWVKKSVFGIQKKEKNIRKVLDSHAKFSFGDLTYNTVHKLEYVYVESGSSVVYYNENAYFIDPSYNKHVKICKKKIFLSYCQKDSNVADIVENGIHDGIVKQGIDRKLLIEISRDIRDVQYKQSFSKFMQTIGEHDYVICIVSNHYLKSRNCMYEVVEVMRDRNFIDRLLFIVVSDADKKYYKEVTDDIAANIYSAKGQTTYLKYWGKERDELNDQIIEIGNPMLTISLAEEVEVMTRIQMDIQKFMNELRDRKGISLEDMIVNDFKDIISCINNNVV